MATDFWPAGIGEGMVTPVTILREQASLLGPKTNQIVKAEVVSHPAGGAAFIHVFYIVVPTLDNYKYELFRVTHTVTLYPATFASPDQNELASNEDQFRQILRTILGSEGTRRLINALLAQVPR